jgi:hypothetical protein
MDQRGPHHIRVIETADGFGVQWQWGHNGRTALYRHFTREELIVPERQGVKGRAPLRGPLARSPLTSHARSYRNVLRALGHELDEVSAQSLLLDQLDDGFLVSYEYPDPRNPVRCRKHMAIVTVKEQQALVQQAYARRRAKSGLAARLAVP